VLKARRILVLGCAGVGKTLFSRTLATQIGAAHVHLDALWREAGGDLERFLARVKNAHAGDAWVSDGNFAAATFDLRLPRADLVIWLDAPRWLCAWRALRRVLAADEHHRVRDVGDVLRFIAGFDRINRPRIEALLAQKAPRTPRLTLAGARVAMRAVARSF
jgi:cytidylate kinase